MKKILLYISLAVFILAMFSCSDSRIYDNIEEIESDEWYSNDVLKFEVSVADTLKAYDILVHVRNTNSYPYSNIWLFVETVSPAGVELSDTVEFSLANASGEWLGKGVGSTNTMLLPYKRNIRFPYRGIYSISIRHGMRSDPLYGVSDVGLKVVEFRPAKK